MCECRSVGTASLALCREFLHNPPPPNSHRKVQTKTADAQQEQEPTAPADQSESQAQNDVTVLSRFQPWMLMTMVLGSLMALLISL